MSERVRKAATRLLRTVLYLANLPKSEADATVDSTSLDIPAGLVPS
jgi:hypothetical protein